MKPPRDGKGNWSFVTADTEEISLNWPGSHCTQKVLCTIWYVAYPSVLASVSGPAFQHPVFVSEEVRFPFATQVFSASDRNHILRHGVNDKG